MVFDQWVSYFFDLIVTSTPHRRPPQAPTIAARNNAYA
jgi:hypothetical protein